MRSGPATTTARPPHQILAEAEVVAVEEAEVEAEAEAEAAVMTGNRPRTTPSATERRGPVDRCIYRIWRAARY